MAKTFNYTLVIEREGEHFGTLDRTASSRAAAERELTAAQSILAEIPEMQKFRLLIQYQLGDL